MSVLTNGQTTISEGGSKFSRQDSDNSNEKNLMVKMSHTLYQFGNKNWVIWESQWDNRLQCLRLDSRLKLSGFITWLGYIVVMLLWTHCYTHLFCKFIYSFFFFFCTLGWHYGIYLIKWISQNEVTYFKFLEQVLKCFKSLLKLR